MGTAEFSDADGKQRWADENQGVSNRCELGAEADRAFRPLDPPGLPVRLFLFSTEASRITALG